MPTTTRCPTVPSNGGNLQDLLALSPIYGQRPAEEETINDPTNPRHYWRFRLHVSLEDLLDDSPYLEKLQALLLGAPCV